MKSWNIIKNNKNCSIPSNFSDANLINDHFIDSIPKLQVTNDFKNYLSASNFNQGPKFESVCVDIDTISKLILSLKTYLVGSDGICGKMLQLSLLFVCGPLTHIINFCFETGCVPLLWKLSSVTPIPKKPNPKDCNDLRPISIQPVCLMLAESALHKHFNDFVVSNNILPSVQSGFQKGYSTTLTLVTLTHDIGISF